MTRIMILPALLAISACTQAADVSRAAQTSDYDANQIAPEGAPPGTCWGKTESPAVVETVSEDRLISPAKYASTGEIQAAPVYETTTRQVIVQERRANWYRNMCPIEMTPTFLGSLQRALELRGYFSGPITQELDDATRDAIARYQTDEAIKTEDTETLTVEAAEKMGLPTVRL